MAQLVSGNNQYISLLYPTVNLTGRILYSGAVRVGLIDNEVIINPTRRELSKSQLNLVVSSTHQNLVVMLEASAENVLQQDFLKAIKAGVKECQAICRAIDSLRKSDGKPKREFAVLPSAPEELLSALKTMSENRLRDILCDYKHDKISRDVAVSTVRNSVIDSLRNNFPNIDPTVISESFNKFYKDLFRKLIFQTDLRSGRKFSLNSYLIRVWWPTSSLFSR